MEKELMDKILSEISKGIEEARKSIKKIRSYHTEAGYNGNYKK